MSYHHLSQKPTVAPDLTEIKHETFDIKHVAGLCVSFQPPLRFSDLRKQRTDKWREIRGQFVFLYETVSQAQTHRRQREARKTQFILPTGPGAGDKFPRSHIGETGGQEAGTGGGDMSGQSLPWGFRSTGGAGQGNSLRLASLSDFRVWGCREVPSCLPLGPGIIKAEKYCLQGCLGKKEETRCAMGWVL